MFEFFRRNQLSEKSLGLVLSKNDSTLIPNRMRLLPQKFEDKMTQYSMVFQTFDFSAESKKLVEEIQLKKNIYKYITSKKINKKFTKLNNQNQIEDIKILSLFALICRYDILGLAKISINDQKKINKINSEMTKIESEIELNLETLFFNKLLSIDWTNTKQVLQDENNKNIVPYQTMFFVLITIPKLFQKFTRYLIDNKKLQNNFLKTFNFQNQNIVTLLIQNTDSNSINELIENDLIDLDDFFRYISTKSDGPNNEIANIINTDYFNPGKNAKFFDEFLYNDNSPLFDVKKNFNSKSIQSIFQNDERCGTVNPLCFAIRAYMMDNNSNKNKEYLVLSCILKKFAKDLKQLEENQDERKVNIINYMLNSPIIFPIEKKLYSMTFADFLQKFQDEFLILKDIDNLFKKLGVELLTIKEVRKEYDNPYKTKIKGELFSKGNLYNELTGEIFDTRKNDLLKLVSFDIIQKNTEEFDEKGYKLKELNKNEYILEESNEEEYKLQNYDLDKSIDEEDYNLKNYDLDKSIDEEGYNLKDCDLGESIDKKDYQLEKFNEKETGLKEIDKESISCEKKYNGSSSDDNLMDCHPYIFDKIDSQINEKDIKEDNKGQFLFSKFKKVIKKVGKIIKNANRNICSIIYNFKYNMLRFFKCKTKLKQLEKKMKLNQEKKSNYWEKRCVKLHKIEQDSSILSL